MANLRCDGETPTYFEETERSVGCPCCQTQDDCPCIFEPLPDGRYLCTIDNEVM